jgi:hypothetical protein
MVLMTAPDAPLMPHVHAPHKKVAGNIGPPVAVNSQTMTKLDAREATRSLTIVLPESQWHALRSVEPDAVGWLQECIRERLSAQSGTSRRQQEPAPRSGPESYWGGDEY